MTLPDQLLSINICIPSSGSAGLKTKDEVNYGKAPDQCRCDRCDYYIAGRCELVAGRIWPEGTCDLWEPNPGPEDSPPGPDVVEQMDAAD